MNTLKKNSMLAISIDLLRNEEASFNVVLEKSSPLSLQVPTVKDQLTEYLLSNKSTSVSGVFSSAGSWAGGAISDDDFLDTVTNMTHTNLDSALFAAHLSSKFLQTGGTLVLTGAEAALDATPGMLAYGIAKSSTHFLVHSVSQDPVFINKGASALCVLPSVIDTPGNRAAMPDENFDNWTKADDIAKICVDWVKDPSTRPPTGSLLSISTQAGQNSTTLRDAKPHWNVISE